MGVTSQTFQFMNRWLQDKHKSIAEFGDQQFLSCPPFPEKQYTRNHWINKGKEYDSFDINGFGDSILINLNEVKTIDKQYDFLTDFGTFEHVNNFYSALYNMHNYCKVGGLMLHVLPALNHWPDHGFGDSILINLNEVKTIDKQYDFLTDFGTFEHVNNFYSALYNMHNYCKVGGLMLHVLPALNHWPDHGTWRAQRPFWLKLGKANGYKIYDVHEESTWIGGHDSDQIYIVYEKIEDSSFVDEETFDTFGLIKAYEFEDYKEGEVFYKNKNLYT